MEIVPGSEYEIGVDWTKKNQALGKNPSSMLTSVYKWETTLILWASFWVELAPNPSFKMGSEFILDLLLGHLLHYPHIKPNSAGHGGVP